MSEIIDRMPYERPAIVRRDLVMGLLIVAKSDQKNDTTVNSDVRVKQNIGPVRWETS